MATNQDFNSWLTDQLNKNPNISQDVQNALIELNTSMQTKQQANASGQPDFDKEFFDKFLDSLLTFKNNRNQMDAEQIYDMWNTVTEHNKITPLTPEMTKIHMEMIQTAESELNNVNNRLQNNQQTWSMDNAPEIEAWLYINNQLPSQNPQQQNDRNERIKASIHSFYRTFDMEHNLEDLSRDSVPMLAANEDVIRAENANFDPFAKDANGNLVHPEFEDVNKFYDNLTIDNSNTKAGQVDKDDFKKQMKELAFEEAVQRLSMNPNFANLPAETQQHMFAELYAQTMEEGMIHLIAAQLAEASRDQDPMPTQQALETQAKQNFENVVNQQAPTEVSNTAALTTLAVRTTMQKQVARRIKQKTGRKSFLQKIKAFDKKLTEKFKLYPMLKNVAISASIGLATGGVGLTVWSAYKFIKTINKTRKNYQEANKYGQYTGFFNYLRKNPKEFVSMGVAAAGAILSGTGVYMDGLNAGNFGLSGQAYQNISDSIANNGVAGTLSNAWDSVSNTASNLWDKATNIFSSSDAAQSAAASAEAAQNAAASAEAAQSAADKASWFGKAWNSISKGASNVWDKYNPLEGGKNLVRTGKILNALGGGIANAAIDVNQAMKATNADDKKRLRKNAMKTALFTTLGSLAGLAMAGTTEAHTETPHADDGATQTPDPNGQGADSNAQGAAANGQGAENNSSTPEDVENPKNLELWKNRAPQFLGKENVDKIYQLVDDKKINLPEGIETKEEYAYKLAMDIQQTPGFMQSELGLGDYHTSAMKKWLEETLAKGKYEEFAKIEKSIVDFDDRGNYTGTRELNPVRTHTGGGHSHSGSHTSTPAPQTQETLNDTPTVDEGKNEQKEQPEQNKEQDTQPPINDIPEETRYERMQEAAGNIKQDVIDAAEKKEDVVQTVWDGMAAQEDAGLVTPEEGTATGNVILNEADTNQNGVIDQNESTPSNMQKAVNNTNTILNAKNQTEEARSHAAGLKVNGYEAAEAKPHPKIYSADTTDPKCYEGAKKLVYKLYHNNTSSSELSRILGNELKRGNITPQQSTIIIDGMNTLNQQGIVGDRAYKTLYEYLKEDVKYYEAQENSKTADWGRSHYEKIETNTATVDNTNAAQTGTPTSDNTNAAQTGEATVDNTKTGATVVEAKEEVKSESGADKTEAAGKETEGAQDVAVPTALTLEDANRLQPGQFAFGKDEEGHDRIIIKDRDGNTAAITIMESGSNEGKQVDVPEDHPLHSQIKNDMSIRLAFAEEQWDSIKNNEYTRVNLSAETSNGTETTQKSEPVIVQQEEKVVETVTPEVVDNSSLSLSDADKLPPHTVLEQKDESGNTQWLLKDKDGHAMIVTQVDILDGKHLPESKWKVEVSPEHPNAKEINGQEWLEEKKAVRGMADMGYDTATHITELPEQKGAETSVAKQLSNESLNRLHNKGVHVSSSEKTMVPNSENRHGPIQQNWMNQTIQSVRKERA